MLALRKYIGEYAICYVTVCGLYQGLRISGEFAQKLYKDSVKYYRMITYPGYIGVENTKMRYIKMHGYMVMLGDNIVKVSKYRKMSEEEFAAESTTYAYKHCARECEYDETSEFSVEYLFNAVNKILTLREIICFTRFDSSEGYTWSTKPDTKMCVM